MKIKDIAHYVTEKIPVVQISTSTYIGMDNMIPNRGGVVPSEYLPEDGYAISFRKGDVLLGNIRPYFKKIWLATFDGGCSQDVLCLRSNGDVSPEFLYCCLAQDSFFDYDVKGAKGSKMPRGDKDHILEFPIIDIKDKNRAGKFVDTITKKIETNNALSSKLEGLARMIYNYWFLQFDFPDENGKPYKSSGGKMVWNDELKREIPEGWRVQPLSHFIAYSKNGDWGNEKPKKASDICVNCFRGADFASITNDYHMTAPVRYIGVKNEDRLLADGDLVTEISGGSPTQATGRIGYINKGFLSRSKNSMTCSNFCKAFTPYDKNYQYWLYQTWKSFYDMGAMFNYESKTTGIKNLMFDEFVTWNKVPEPNRELVMLYQKEIDLYYGKIQSLLIENQELASLHDFLLPLLMNGQVTFKDKDLSNANEWAGYVRGLSR